MLTGNVAGQSTPNSWHISRGTTPSRGWRVVTRMATTAAGWCDRPDRPSDSLQASSSVRQWAYRPTERLRTGTCCCRQRDAFDSTLSLSACCDERNAIVRQAPPPHT